LPNLPTVALVGSDSLLAREVRDIVATTEADLDLRLVAAVDEESGALTRMGDEPTVVNLLNAESLLDARAVILAGNAQSSRQALDLLGDPPDAAVIDLTYSAEERPDARLRAPLVESVQVEDPADVAVHVIAHPAAIALALFMRRLHANDPIRSAVIQIFAPASEHGAPGVHELQQQTVSLLSFKNLPKDVFDTQLSFNLLARYGDEAPVSLEESELRIERHLASLLALPGDGEGALELLLDKKEDFDAVVLDVMLPGKDGFTVASELRAARHFVPVLMLTARGRPEDILKLSPETITGHAN